ncbi:MAG: hypothetical protein ACRDSJ_07695, partial [Rubrobacteraceae bacterium]
DRVPALDGLPTIEPALLQELIEKSLFDLVLYGLDPLHVELVLAMIDDAHEHDRSAEPPDPRRQWS